MIVIEWYVEVCDGGMCVVCVVYCWFVDFDEWDDEFDGYMYGW